MVDRCMICGEPTTYFFSKSYTANRYWDALDVNYNRCGNCGFTFSITHQHLSDEEWEHINARAHHGDEIDIKTKAKNLAQNLDFYGVLAIELFELLDGSIVFNEIAPRPHNSFHWTLNGSNISQFDILIRTMCGLPVKDVEANGKWEMINLIGQDVNDISIYEDQNYILHIYGKKNVKAGRKMGHYNRNIS